MGTTYWGHELDLARSHDINRMTIQLTICYFLSCPTGTELNLFRHICIKIYRGNDLDLSGYVTSPVTWPFDTAGSQWQFL